MTWPKSIRRLLRRNMSTSSRTTGILASILFYSSLPSRYKQSSITRQAEPDGACAAPSIKKHPQPPGDCRFTGSTLFETSTRTRTFSSGPGSPLCCIAFRTASATLCKSRSRHGMGRFNSRIASMTGSIDRCPWSGSLDRASSPNTCQVSSSDASMSIYVPYLVT
jgi:hypothetical protein